MTSATEIFVLDSNVRYRRLLDEAVVIHQEQAEALVLNDTAIAFIELCDGCRSTGEIIREMTGRYDVKSDELEGDLQPFIEELLAAGIIRPATENEQ
jgi:hypothetical protein